MAASPIISMAAAQAMLNALTALFNVGGAGVLKIFTGSPPATCETADTGSLLATFNLNATAFASATDSGTGLAVATANTIASVTASGTGTAGYFRAYPHTPTTTNAIDQDTVGTSSAGLVLSTTSINAGDTLDITSWVINMPDGSGAD
jgi:hypothetical protein